MYLWGETTTFASIRCVYTRINNIMMKRIYWALFLLAVIPTLCLAQSGKNVHVVQPKETLYRIGLKYGVTVAELYKLNPGTEKGINVGQSLVLPDRVPPQQSEQYHSVKSGETLYSISRVYGVSIEAILAANPDLSDITSIPVGIILKIPSVTIDKGQGASQVAPQTPPVSPTEEVTGLVVMTVEPKQTVYSILKMTGWTEEEFYHYNPHVRGGLKAGQTIFIPDVTLANNRATPSFAPGVGNIAAQATDVVLTLPFSNDAQHRFSDYYEGFLLMLKEAKAEGASVNLHVFDCGDPHLANTISEIRSLPKIDLMIGGVSHNSVDLLAQIAKEKGTLYVVPFTSKNMSVKASGDTYIYQINTPHNLLYDVAVDKFLSQYRDYDVHFLQFDGDSEEKTDFVNLLKQKLKRAGRSYTESPHASASSTMSDLLAKPKPTVIVPTSGSYSAAQTTLVAITEVTNTEEDSQSEQLTVFGYPEWQTYVSQLEALFHRTGTTFYTTFFPNPRHKGYQSFEREYISWFGHGIGTTFPRYSILGYDTGYYFLMPGLKSAVTGPSSNSRRDTLYEGIQSKFDFQSTGSNLYSNLGVFLVTYNRFDRSTSIN